MIEVKLMIVPGKIARVNLNGARTVIDAATEAQKAHHDVDWVELTKSREVRVQNRKFSNKEEIPEGYFGSILSTPLEDGDVVLVLTKIKGNGSFGPAVLTCTINGTEYALETPDTVGNVLNNVAGINVKEIDKVLINSEESPLDQMVGNGDRVEVNVASEVTVTYRGKSISGTADYIISRLFR